MNRVCSSCRLSFSFAASRLAAVAFVLSAGAAAGCGGSTPSPAASAGPPAGAMPPMPVDIVTLTPKPVEQTSELVGIIRSRRSTTIQPQAEGFLTKILVKSGDHVEQGTPLAEIDNTSQQAVVAGLQSTRAARESDATYADQQAAREKALLNAGAASQQEYDQAVAAARSAAAQLKALDDQIRQQQNELAYFRVVAPTAGIVGDIPVRTGDRVTKSTVITTIDDNEGLEVYINVPVEQASRLRPNLTVQITDDSNKVVATTAISFVAPSVDDATQTILVKAPVPASSRLRTDQFVRATIVWSTAPGLTVPVVAVTRVNGQAFVFVATNTGRGLAAHLQPVTVGPVIGNDYVLLGGLKAGDRLIVSGLQKIGEGSPVA